MKTYKTTPSAIRSRFHQFERVKVQIKHGYFSDSMFADVKSARQLPNTPDTIWVRESDGFLTIVCDADLPSYVD